MYYSFSRDKIGYKKMLCEIDKSKVCSVPVRIPTIELFEAFLEYMLVGMKGNMVYVQISNGYEKDLVNKIVETFDSLEKKKMDFKEDTKYNFILSENHLIVLTPNSNEIGVGILMDRKEFAKVLKRFGYLKHFFDQ